MLFENVTIEALAYELPPHRITSASLEEQVAETMERLEIPSGQIEALTGIRERRYWDRGTTPSDAATLAARKVIDMAGIDPHKIGCLINTSVCKDYIEPSVACLVHGNLVLSPHCLNYDIGNACLGFVNGMNSIGMMIEAGLIDYGMVVDAEDSREINEATIERLQGPDVSAVTFYQNFAALTLGSGAVAMILGRKDASKSGHSINGDVNLAATQHSRLCLGHRKHMVTDSHALLMAGKELGGATWKLACEALEGWSDDNIALYAPHQVSDRQIMMMKDALGLTVEKLHLNLYTQGNTGPAALPITLKMAEEAGRIQTGDHVALLGIGSGLNCSMMSVTW